MAAKKSGLGKGLDSLIPEKTTGGAAKGKAASEGKDILLVDINKIEPNPDQPRKTVDDYALLTLASSIRQHGLLQPITVRDPRLYANAIKSVVAQMQETGLDARMEIQEDDGWIDMRIRMGK